MHIQKELRRAFKATAENKKKRVTKLFTLLLHCIEIVCQSISKA